LKNKDIIGNEGKSFSKKALRKMQNNQAPWRGEGNLY